MKWPLCVPIVLLLALGCNDDATNPPADPGPLSVMSWNIYLGADLNPVLAAPPAEIPMRAAEVWAQVQQTDFPGRAAQIAAEIKTHLPHVVGLQEVSLYRMQSPGDAAVGGTVAATVVVLDHLDILMQALATAGLDYEVAAVTLEFDVEIPMLVGAQLDDIRLTDRDVILVRKGVAKQDIVEQNFTSNAQLQVGGGPALTFKRGWNSVVVNFFGQQVRILNTHLEGQAFATIQQAQATELLDQLQGETLPALIMGDFNSDASGSQTPTYADLISGGCLDLWKASDGFTCCQDADLLNATAKFDQRIDFLFSVGTKVPTIVDMQRVGIVKNPLWASDHAGLVVQLRYD